MEPEAIAIEDSLEVTNLSLIVGPRVDIGLSQHGLTVGSVTKPAIQTRLMSVNFLIVLIQMNVFPIPHALLISNDGLRISDNIYRWVIQGTSLDGTTCQFLSGHLLPQRATGKAQLYARVGLSRGRNPGAQLLLTRGHTGTHRTIRQNI